MLSRNTAVLAGWDALRARTRDVDALHDRIGSPVDTRLPWLEVWTRPHRPAARPVAAPVPG